MGTANDLSPSALVSLGLRTAVSVAPKGNGQYSGGAPEIEIGVEGGGNGSQGQLSCGEKVTVMEQDWPDPRSNWLPCDGAPPAPQASVSLKLNKALKSLPPLNDVPVMSTKLNVKPRTELESFASVIVWVVEAEFKV
jgi:hypothetical protein